MQALNRIADLYQTDMDRHLYAFEARRRQPGEPAAFVLLAGRVREWMGGWARWRAVLANGVFFF